MNKQEKVMVQFVRVMDNQFDIQEKKVVEFDSETEAKTWIKTMRAIDRETTYTNFSIRPA